MLIKHSVTFNNANEGKKIIGHFFFFTLLFLFLIVILFYFGYVRGFFFFLISCNVLYREYMRGGKEEKNIFLSLHAWMILSNVNCNTRARAMWRENLRSCIQFVSLFLFNFSVYNMTVLPSVSTYCVTDLQHRYYIRYFQSNTM